MIDCTLFDSSGSVIEEVVEEKDKLLFSVEAHDVEIAFMAVSSNNMIATSDVHHHLKVILLYLIIEVYSAVGFSGIQLTQANPRICRTP